MIALTRSRLAAALVVILYLRIGQSTESGILLAATGRRILEGNEFRTLVTEICASEVQAKIIVATKNEAKYLQGKVCAKIEIKHLSFQDGELRSTKLLRQFKVKAVNACPFAKTLYLDNDVEIDHVRLAIDHGFELMSENQVIGTTISANCLPVGHALKHIPDSFCERNGGVLYLRCPRAIPLLSAWLNTLYTTKSADGHDQPALRGLAYHNQAKFAILPRHIFNCRHPCGTLSHSKKHPSSSSSCLIYHAHIPKYATNRSEVKCFRSPVSLNYTAPMLG